MNTASNTARTRAVTSTRATWLVKLRALALHAVNLHLQNCAVIAEAHRRPN